MCFSQSARVISQPPAPMITMATTTLHPSTSGGTTSVATLRATTPPFYITNEPVVNRHRGAFKIQPDTWLRTMLVFYSLNARLNHLAGDHPHEYWMTKLPNRVRNRPLSLLTIPGSHDSFAYSLDTGTSSLAPDMALDLRTAAQMLSNLIPTFKFILHNWSKTQQLSFIEQLNAGIRYFDIRVGFYKETKQMRFLHGLWGNVVKDELAKMPAWLDKHPGEVVMLDFNHMYFNNELDHMALVDLVTSIIGEYIIPFCDWSIECTIPLFTNLTLANLAKAPRRQVVVIYQHKLGIVFSKAVFWPNFSVRNVWPQTKSTEKMLATIQDAYDERVIEVRNSAGNDTLEPPGTFFVYQGILTPDAEAIVSNLLGSLYESSLTYGTSSFVKWLESKRSNAEGALNICIVDGVESFNFIPTVIALNNY